MKRKLLRVLIFTGIASLLIHCECKKNILGLQEQLPPATQTGANTFGCYVNGKLWVPKGNVGRTNPYISFDPSYHGGSLGIGVYRILNSTVRQYIYIYSDSVNNTGTFDLSNLNKGSVLFNFSISCNYDRDSLISRKGNLTITNFDLQHQIISGTFQFTLAKPGCDTVKVTDGRFDMKF